MNTTDSLIKLTEQKEKHWPTALGLALAISINLSFFAALRKVFPFVDLYPLVFLTLFLFSILIILSFWIRSRRLPAFRDKPGILLIIKKPNDEKDAEVVATEFLETIKSQIEKSTNSKFSVEETSIYQTSLIGTFKKAQQAGIVSNAIAVVYGKVISTLIENKPSFVIDCSAFFRHSKLENSTQKEYQDIVNQSFVSRYITIKENSFIEFETNSKILTSSVLYLLAHASAYSGNGELSEQLFRSVLKLNSKQSGLNGFINQNIASHFSSLMLSKADYYYRLWKDSSEESLLEEMTSALKDVNDKYKNNPQYLVLKSIEEVATRNDIDSALNYLNNIRTDLRDGVWFFNTGFLYFLKENYVRAHNRYLKGKKYPTSMPVILDLESFIVWYRDNYNKPELSLLLAMLNIYIKNDIKQAQVDFNAFASLNIDKKYSQSIIDKVENEIKESLATAQFQNNISALNKNQC